MLLYNEMAYWFHKMCVMLDPRIEMARCYHKTFGRWPDLDKPKTLIEKIYWLQLNTDTSLWTLCADKYKVREYLIKKKLENYLNDLYGVWNSPEEIDFKRLPERYVLKTNNGCSQTIISDGSAPLSLEYVKRKLDWWNRHLFGVSGGELHYLKIPRKIIAEKLLPFPEGETSMIDYKIWCFDGEPYSIWVNYNRTRESTFINVYDLDWNLRPEASIFNERFKDGKGVVPKPECLDEMFTIARILSEGFPEVRVDLYLSGGKIYFGELTFASVGGMMKRFSDDYLRELGAQCVLPEKKRRNTK